MRYILLALSAFILVACQSSGGKLDCMQKECPCPKKKGCGCSHKCACKKHPC